ncbi:unnamed protein product [Protopolystoma xenopodis]|uniref:Uncharacterized protein n=1 Tax=Protopolystoma xenopodis TaxID=117903 RepID=A0A448XAU0_9PLAT|nr:unnamed protein product [Protopolystoma xenopodis]
MQQHISANSNEHQLPVSSSAIAPSINNFPDALYKANYIESLDGGTHRQTIQKYAPGITRAGEDVVVEAEADEDVAKLVHPSSSWSSEVADLMPRPISIHNSSSASERRLRMHSKSFRLVSLFPT